ncbi:protein FAM133-like [Bombina bombina]|uniref:protein FAM133-like n=1 Tax=Bombina bombina TaxID=8345 RepID=UPI00235A58D8|nr:protein FAM133-like [Bombina bombina]
MEGESGNLATFFDIQNRKQFFDTIFSSSANTTCDGDLKQLFNTLEKLLMSDLRSMWDVVKLTHYIDVKRIPRGLRIKKYPNYDLEDSDLQDEWNTALNECSLKLLGVLVKSKEKKRNNLKDKILTTKADLKTRKTEKQYAELKSQMKEKIKKADAEIAEKKKNKFLRDREDYDNNRVYDWSRFRRRHRRPTKKRSNDGEDNRPLKPILKKDKERRVVFSSTEPESTDRDSDSTGSSDDTSVPVSPHPSSLSFSSQVTSKKDKANSDKAVRPKTRNQSSIPLGDGQEDQGRKRETNMGKQQKSQKKK